MEVVPQIIESGAPSLAKFMFRGKNLEKFEMHKSILIPHELLRSGNRYKPDPNYNNEIRGGGTTNKEAPLWAPSGKNLTTPEKYTRISKLVNATYTQVGNKLKDMILGLTYPYAQLMNDYDFDRRVANSKKRYQKAQKRSEDWIEQQLVQHSTSDTKLILPVLAQSDSISRGFHLDFIKKKVTQNENICALCLNGETDPMLNNQNHNLIKIYLDALDFHELPIACYDLNSPNDLIFGVENGVSIFGGQYPFMMANKHRAIVLPNKTFRTRKIKIINFEDKDCYKLDTGICSGIIIFVI